VKKALPILLFVAAAVFGLVAVSEAVSGHWGRSILAAGQLILWAGIGFSLRQSQKRH
jgi:hypothetical protein